VKIDKTVAASVALHALVIGWGLVSFSTRAFESMPEDSVPVDIISADQFAKAMAGMKTGKKENPKPLVEKVAEPKPPVDDAVGKIDDKKPPVVTDAAPPPTPKPEEKPVEKKPDQAKVDPIAEALKKEEAKKPPKPQQVKATPPPPDKQKAERTFDQSKIAALLDKRDPTRASITGAAINSQASLGTARGTAADNSATWGAMFRQQVERCWKKPYGGVEAQKVEAVFTIKLKRDGTLETMPVPLPGGSSPYFRVYQESAQRAIIECQPYNLPAAFFDEWKFFEPAFTEKFS